MQLDRPRYNLIPTTLQELPQWVLWRNLRGTKVPFQRGGKPASSTNPETWSSFDAVTESEDQCDGIGFVFREGGGLVGIDLDGCRDPDTGEVDVWAGDIVRRLASYAEVSPSRSGIKIFCKGSSPFDSGRKCMVDGLGLVGGKQPAIEIYDRGRYFAVTGWRLGGLAREPIEADLSWLAEEYFKDEIPGTRNNGRRVSDWYSNDSVRERARAYLGTMEPAVSGQGGHNQTFKCACALVLGFGLDDNVALQLLGEWNLGCTPPWSERDLIHKIKSAGQQDGERGYLRDAKPAEWAAIEAKRESPEATAIAGRTTTLVEAARRQLQKIRDGEDDLFELGIPPLDRAIGGGVADGELVIIAARPSHGKSMVALQIAHHWTAKGENVLIISEEMSALALGKRALQFLSETPRHEWRHNLDSIEAELNQYAAKRGRAIVIESCGTVAAAVEQIEKAVAEQGVKAVFIDYLQLLRGQGKGRYEQVSNASTELRQLTTKLNIRIVELAQLNREVEKRSKFVPQASDLRDSGQIEQDADVVMCLCWPCKLDDSRDKAEFQVFVCKNRNREIMAHLVDLRFDADRQRIEVPQAKDLPNYERSFDNW
jgi:replicative DNA helicase